MMTTNDDRSAGRRGTARHGGWTKIGAEVGGQLAIGAAARGPRPPALVCRDCDVTINPTFANPLLETAKLLGRYAGETTGGVAICDRCGKGRDARVQALTDGPKRAAVLDVPERERASSLANFAARTGTKAAIAAAKTWLEARDRDLYIFGVTGTGKTRLGISLANDVVRGGLVLGDVIYVRVPSLIARLKAHQFDQDRSAGEFGKTQTYVRAGLLVLDDLGAENGTPYTRTTIESIYNDRLDAGRLTIITSNLPLGLSLLDQAKAPADRLYPMALGDYLGDDRMTSRIAGNAQIVEIGGEDYRLGGWQKTRGTR